MKIVGLTQKGKNRIKEHGDVWRVIKVAENGDKLLEAKDGYLKWLHPDFEESE